MHIAYIPEILLKPIVLAQRFLPRMYQIENAAHDWTREGRRALRKASDKLIQELFRRDLQVERIAAVLDECRDQCER